VDYTTPKDYFAGYEGSDEISQLHRSNAAGMLVLVNKLLGYATTKGVILKNNPVTHSLVGGEKNGGWRPQACPIGAPGSAHKQGQAVDVYDPDGALDDFLTDDILRDFGLYREHPASTRGWCHLTTRAPSSGKRTFYP
jgi:hypothetical protein